eukprot:COSAG06_NODE_61391_length_268_cov_0.485207_1_plen_57_part_01
MGTREGVSGGAAGEKESDRERKTESDGERKKARDFFKQKTAYGIMSGDWSSDVCSSD